MRKANLRVIVFIMVISLLCPVLLSCNTGDDVQASISDETSATAPLIPHLEKKITRAKHCGCSQ